MQEPGAAPTATTGHWFTLPVRRPLAVVVNGPLVAHLEALTLRNPVPANCALSHRARTNLERGPQILPARVDEAMPVWLVEDRGGRRHPALPADHACQVALVIEGLSEGPLDPLEIPVSMLGLSRRPARALPGPCVESPRSVEDLPWRWHQLERMLGEVAQA